VKPFKLIFETYFFKLSDKAFRVLHFSFLGGVLVDCHAVLAGDVAGRCGVF
jgi:hypothetical protein